MIIAVDETGRMSNSLDLQAVNRLLKLRKEKPFWEVVAGVVDMWIKRDEKEWKSYILHLDAVKKDQKVRTRGSKSWRGVSVDKESGVERSLVVDFPIWIDMCLRVLYKGDDIQFDKKFYRKFARRFPIFRIREKV